MDAEYRWTMHSCMQLKNVEQYYRVCMSAWCVYLNTVLTSISVMSVYMHACSQQVLFMHILISSLLHKS